MTSSVSFRITAQQKIAQPSCSFAALGETEQRQGARLHLRQRQKDLNVVPDEEISALEGVEALLRETRELLDSTAPMADESLPSDSWGHENGTEMSREVA